MLSETDALSRLQRLADPIGGLADRLTRIPPSSRLSERFHMYSAYSGNVGYLAPETMPARQYETENDPVGGAGSDLEPDKARIRALAECVERYASILFRNAEVVVETARGLGTAAIDLDSLPRNSEREFADPRCPLRRASKDAAIRWVPALSLHDGAERYVPLVCTHLLHRPWPTELFTNSISTGVAAHFSFDRALLNALYEVIERDAIATLWLGRLQLPRFAPSPELLADWGLDPGSAIRTLFFDATLDLDARSVYVVQLCDDHPYASQVVGCATDHSLEDACRKVVRETLCYRTKFELEIPIPDQVADFVRLQDGAAYMGRPEQRSGFQFLIDRPAVDMPTERRIPTSDREKVRGLLESLERAGIEVYLIDLTTDELRDAGLWVLRAIIPQLMPMSPIYRSRFLGHPRLYEVARRVNENPEFSESDVNPLPQPFA